MPGDADRTGDRPDTRPAEAPAAPTVDASRLIETNQRAMRAALEAHSQSLQHIARIGSSVFGFIQWRLQHDAQFAQQLGTARTADDAYAAYHDFFDVAVREYSDEFSALATLCADQTRETIQQAERQVDRFARPVLAAE